MAAWRYVGYCGQQRAWTNEVDVAWSDFYSPLQDSEIDNFPHSSARIIENEIVDKYDGDVMAWVEREGIRRQSLDDIR